jgi:hypothetical protein
MHVSTLETLSDDFVKINILDEERRLTFGYVNDRNRIVEVKIPIDGVEVDVS